VNIAGPNGQQSAVINCATSSKRQLWVSDLKNTTITLRYITLTKGYGYNGNGGCVYASGIQQLNIDNVVFTNCTAVNGGGLYSNSPSSISNSTFSYNNAGAGGALYLESLVPGTSVADSSIISNMAALGAGIYLFGDYLSVTQSIIAFNAAFDYGGGLYIASPTPTQSGNYNFLGTNITSNNGTLQGGGVYAENLSHPWNIFGALLTDNWSSDVKGDSNIACNATAPQFCYACTAKDCTSQCTADGTASCSQILTSTPQIYCYGTKFDSCSDSSCTCAAKSSKIETILFVVIALLLAVGIVLIAVDVARHVIKKRQGNDYTPIK
jgi:hypothetical protein